MSVACLDSTKKLYVFIYTEVYNLSKLAVFSSNGTGVSKVNISYAHFSKVRVLTVYRERNS